MTAPLVRCGSCERAWHSATMADGLRAVGTCPRCGGELLFAEPASDAPHAPVAPVPASDTAPHLVLGVPRR